MKRSYLSCTLESLKQQASTANEPSSKLNYEQVNEVKTSNQTTP